MVERYTRPEMGAVWSEENKYRIWLEIEILAVEAQSALGLVPKEAVLEIRQKANFDVKRILEIEETTKHDVIAFLTNVEEYVGEPARFIHLGMTSSDVLDTCLAVQINEAGRILLDDMNKLKAALEKRAIEHKYTVCVGRSHGIHAEAMTFGTKFALWYDECNRNITRLESALEDCRQGMISGAVGTYEHLSPFVEEYVCKKLGLKPANVSTQVISRDSHAYLMTVIGIIGSMLEKIGIEIRHLQRTEVREAEEFFSKGQKGSSAMPHKRNPIASENISGQARLLRSNSIAAIENNALWHERDISHSSVERVIFPDSTIALDYILNRAIRLIDNLVVYPERMIENLNLTYGLIHSQKILLELAKRGIQRQTAYVIVQRNAMRTWDEKIPFIESLCQDDELLSYISKSELEKLFSYDKVFESVDYIFKNCGLN
ncbi:MAG: adenylosuccinate lyase [Candidatus Kapabacteria bacterium]|nr:adenylosuccinate lyase [Ignavibacteriota bacterium]MCW5883493.1 adenylosuccinate lyase [Candidatus Kapabacteria bacterium]